MHSHVSFRAIEYIVHFIHTFPNVFLDIFRLDTFCLCLLCTFLMWFSWTREYTSMRAADRGQPAPRWWVTQPHWRETLKGFDQALWQSVFLTGRCVLVAYLSVNACSMLFISVLLMTMESFCISYNTIMMVNKFSEI